MSIIDDNLAKITDHKKCIEEIIEMAKMQKWIKYDGSTELSIVYTTYVVNYDILWEVEKTHDLVNDLFEHKIRIVDEIMRFRSHMLVDHKGNITRVIEQFDDETEEDD